MSEVTKPTRVKQVYILLASRDCAVPLDQILEL